MAVHETKTMERELHILFGALCDGVRQEVRARSLTPLNTDEDFSLSLEREPGVQSAVALQLRSVGFLVQIESWLPDGDQRRRPDLRVWLPSSTKYLYLELKTYGWGEGPSYYYSTTWDSVQADMGKLKSEGDSGHLPNGLVVVGFSKPHEQRSRMTLSQAYDDLSQRITSRYPYQKIGVQEVDLQGMDQRTSYAMIGLWVRMPHLDSRDIPAEP